MDSLFYKRLDNFWDQVASSGKKHRFLLRVVAKSGMLDAEVTLTLRKDDVVRVIIISAESDWSDFTDIMLYEIREDILNLVRHYYPVCRVVRGTMIVGETKRELSWFAYESLAEEA